MRTASLQFLETLVNTPSPVGHETRGQRVWLDHVAAFADEISRVVSTRSGRPRQYWALRAASSNIEVTVVLKVLAEPGDDTVVASRTGTPWLKS